MTNVLPQETDVLRDQGSKVGTLKSTEEILANGGCKVALTIYENGHEWHPVLPSHGEQKCITCHCKVRNFKFLNLFIFFLIASFSCPQPQDTVIACDRKRCTRSICNNRVSAKRKHSSSSAAAAFSSAGAPEKDECCTTQCRRSRRHQNQKRLHNKETRERHAAAAAAAAAAAQKSS